MGIRIDGGIAYGLRLEKTNDLINSLEGSFPDNWSIENLGYSDEGEYLIIFRPSCIYIDSYEANSINLHILHSNRPLKTEEAILLDFLKETNINPLSTDIELLTWISIS